MELVTLENTFGNLADTTNEPLVVTRDVPHFSALKNPEIAGDITWANYGKEGAALGNNQKGLQTGIFRDNNGNTLIVAVESNPAYKVARELNLYGNPIQFNIDRFFGTGNKFELNAQVFLMETNPFSAANALVEMGENPFRTQNGFTYTNVFDLFSQIERTGKRFDRNILFLMSGEPVTLASILDKVLDYVLVGAKLIGTMLGVPPMLLDVATPIISKLAKGEKVTIGDIGVVAKLLCPADVRPYLDKAVNVVSAAQRQDYVAISKEFGIDISEATRFFNNSLQNIATDAGIGFDQANKTLQNIFNIDTITRFRNTLRSGSAIEKIIDDGTIVNVPSVQNWLLAQQTGISTVVPNIGKFASAVINETSDITTPEEFRTMFQTGFGLPTHPDALDGITIRSLVQRAINTRELTNSKSFTLPASVPIEKRETYAAEISKQSGMYVNANLRRKVWY